MSTVTCIKCGHTNFVHTEMIEVRVLDLTHEDIGLQILINGRTGPLTHVYPDGAGQHRAIFALTAMDRNAEWNEPDSWTSFFYQPEDTIMIWRPIA